MKTMMILAAALALATSAFSQANIEFASKVYDFGSVAHKADAKTSFEFTNTGDEPLIISNAEGSCGCTVPDWPRTPIRPGEKAMITVKYDSKRIGPINKSVKVYSNGSESPVMLRIKGSVQSAT